MRIFMGIIGGVVCERFFGNGKWKGSSSIKIQQLTQFALFWDTANAMAIQIKGEFVHLNFPSEKRSFSAFPSECTLWRSYGKAQVPCLMNLEDFPVVVS